MPAQAEAYVPSCPWNAKSSISCTAQGASEQHGLALQCLCFRAMFRAIILILQTGIYKIKVVTD